MTLIGVTGAFCTGKTTVAGFFKDLGAYTIDADKVVHRLYRENKNIKEAILNAFGKKVFAKNIINKKKLGELAFRNKKNLKKLCAIIHPEVIKKIKEDVSRFEKDAMLVIDAPLLIEAGLHRFVDFVVVVSANPGTQIRRCRMRNFTKKDLLKRQKAQMSLSEKEKHADFIIDNNGRKRDTRKDVEKLWEELKRRKVNG